MKNKTPRERYLEALHSGKYTKPQLRNLEMNLLATKSRVLTAKERWLSDRAQKLLDWDTLLNIEKKEFSFGKKHKLRRVQ